jgi:uncharacterized membrane protein
MPTSTTVRRVFVPLAIAWAAALVLAPLAIVHGTPGDGGYAFAFLVYAIGSLVCHQIPGRSFHLGSVALPVCARCLGIYAGVAAAAIFAAWFQPPWMRVRTLQIGGGAWWRRAFAVALMPAAATLGYEWGTAQVPSNLVRALSGFPIGVAVSLVLVGATWGAADPGAPRAGRRPFGETK